MSGEDEGFDERDAAGEEETRQNKRQNVHREDKRSFIHKETLEPEHDPSSPLMEETGVPGENPHGHRKSFTENAENKSFLLTQ